MIAFLGIAIEATIAIAIVVVIVVLLISFVKAMWELAFKKCETCPRKRLWFMVKRRTVNVPQLGQMALSQAEMCRNCHKSVKKMLATNPAHDGK